MQSLLSLIQPKRSRKRRNSTNQNVHIQPIERPNQSNRGLCWGHSGDKNLPPDLQKACCLCTSVYLIIEQSCVFGKPSSKTVVPGPCYCFSAVACRCTPPARFSLECVCARETEPGRQTGERRSYLAALRSSMRQAGGVFGLLYTNITLPCLLLLITCDWVLFPLRCSK